MPATPGRTPWTKCPTVVSRTWSTTARLHCSTRLNPTCLRCNNYSNSDYDIRSYFSASYVWQTPWKFGNKYANGAFGGWTLSQNFFARTGLPYTHHR